MGEKSAGARALHLFVAGFVQHSRATSQYFFLPRCLLGPNQQQKLEVCKKCCNKYLVNTSPHSENVLPITIHVLWEFLHFTKIQTLPKHLHHAAIPALCGPEIFSVHTLFHSNFCAVHFILPLIVKGGINVFLIVM